MMYTGWGGGGGGSWMLIAWGTRTRSGSPLTWSMVEDRPA
jgi:hypothetical protein